MKTSLLLSFALGVVLLSAALWPARLLPVAATQTTAAFEIALPEFGLAPTAQAEIRIPSPAATQILITLLRPQSDDVDYGQIYTRLNGEATAALTDITGGERGKLIRLNLTRLPGYRLVAGRNTVEVTATSRRNRTYYASFVLRTTGASYNAGFGYQTAMAEKNAERVPPELVLIEPENEILLAPGARARAVRVRGYATAAQPIARVSVNGQAVTLTRNGAPQARKLSFSNPTNTVSFDTAVTPPAGATEITVEAADAAGNRTQLSVPVRERVQAAAPARFAGRRFALIVGVSKFRSTSIPPLQYADADARALYDFLQTPAGGRFPAGNVMLLTNEQATLGKLREGFQQFIAQPSPDDLLLIFFASHGGPDPRAQQNLYFIAHDSELERLSETALPMKEAQRLIQENVRARRVVMLFDACHSAGLIEPPKVTARALSNNLVNLYAEKLYQEEGRAIITSADVNEQALESPDWGGGHGVFTHFLLQGLRGEADADGDRLVTLGEAFRFVRRRVETETGNLQHPRLLVGTNENLALAVAAGR